MLLTLIQRMPGGENMKVFIGTILCCAIGGAPVLARWGKGYDSMAEKRAALATVEAEKEAKRAAKAAAKA